MLKNIEKLDAEMRRLRPPLGATITPEAGRQPVYVKVGEVAEFLYNGERRRVEVMKVESWGLRCRDLATGVWKGFRFDRIGLSNPPATRRHEEEE